MSDFTVPVNSLAKSAVTSIVLVSAGSSPPAGGLDAVRAVATAVGAKLSVVTLGRADEWKPLVDDVIDLGPATKGRLGLPGRAIAVLVKGRAGRQLARRLKRDTQARSLASDADIVVALGPPAVLAVRNATRRTGASAVLGLPGAVRTTRRLAGLPD